MTALSTSGIEFVVEHRARPAEAQLARARGRARARSSTAAASTLAGSCGVEAGDRLQQQRGIAGRAAHRADVVEGPGERNHAAGAHQPVGRLQPGDAAVRGRLADRAAGVRAERAVTEPRRDGCGRAAGGAARDAVERPGIVHGAEVPGRRAHAVGALVHVELAEQDGAGLVQTPRDLGVRGGHAVGEGGRGRGRADAGGVDVVLERDRDAVQRAAPSAPPDLRFHVAGAGERLLRRSP